MSKPESGVARKSQYKLAVGLSYDRKKQDAPQVSIKGENLVADEVVKIAKRYGVPVVEKPQAAQSLRDVEVDQTIPESLYKAVALILQAIKQRLIGKK